MEPVAVHIGADIGQRSDPTALCVATVERRTTGRMLAHHDELFHVVHGRCNAQCVPEMESVYTTRFLERLAIGTAYPAVAERLADVVTNLLPLVPGLRPHLYVDVTGVGRPVFDLVVNQVRDRCRLSAVTFRHGHRCERDPENDMELSLGKAYLVSRLQALLQTKRIILPQTGEAQALAQELQTYEIRVDQDSSDKYGAFRVGTHDDLVTALGLACLEEPRSNSAVGAFLNLAQPPRAPQEAR